MTKDTTKRGRGRPRKQPAPEGASLREAAAALGITRRQLLRSIDEGMPSTLHNERRFVDIDAARAWLEERESEPAAIPTAKRIHPSDPRFRLSVASGKVRRLEYDLAMGRAFTVEDIRHRFGPAISELNARLKSVHTQLLGVTPANVGEMLRPIIEDALGDFSNFDDESKWPAPILPNDIDEEPTEDEGAEFEGQPVEYLPVLVPSDSRFEDARVKGLKAEARLAELQSCTIYRDDALQIVRGLANGVREVLRQIPQWVADAVRDGDDETKIANIIDDKIEVARILIRGPQDGPGAEAIAALCGDGNAFPSVLRLLQDSVVTDDDEFEPRKTVSVAAVWPLLAQYPNLPKPGAEFG